MVSFGIEDVVAANRISIAAVVRASEFHSWRRIHIRANYVEDYDLWLRLLARGARHIHNPESLVLYRVGGGSKTAQFAHRRWIAWPRSTGTCCRPSLSIGAVAAAVRDQLAATHRDVGRLRAQDDRASLESRLAAGDYAGAKATVLVIKKGFHRSHKVFSGAWNCLR